MGDENRPSRQSRKHHTETGAVGQSLTLQQTSEICSRNGSNGASQNHVPMNDEDVRYEQNTLMEATEKIKASQYTVGH